MQTNTTKTTLLACAACLSIAVLLSLTAWAQEPRGGPSFRDGTNLNRPTNYREWQFLSSSLNMSYQPPGDAQPQLFQNVFVNPSSYRGFMETGRWPDETMFVLEIRQSSSEGAITGTGQFQSDLVALEAEVKDDRFADGWAFYDFGTAQSLADVATPLAGVHVARCIECHTEHTAVERTFVQFYPTLLEVARQKGTVKPGF